ncbi:MAG: ribonuclease J [Oscillospiraceae bacterium]
MEEKNTKKTIQKNTQQKGIKPMQTKKVQKPAITGEKEKTNQQRQNNRPKKQPQGKGTPNITHCKNGNTISHYNPVQKRRVKKQPIKIIPLGGLNEIGKNMTVYECGDDIIIVDCGLAFPDENMLGVDIVIPDFTYVKKNKDKIRGIFITHGHEDHIGGLAFLLSVINAPVYATRLTIGLIEGKLKEHKLVGDVELNVVSPRDVVTAGCMTVEFIGVNHSIPDACALAITCPAGVLIQTGDFKIDYTPIQSEIIDLARFGELGSRGVLALLSDSTNSECPGNAASERAVGESFDKLFKKAIDKRIIIATFASNIHRIQQIVNASYKYGKKVAVSGRSMVNVVNKAMELGYLNMPENVFIDIDMIGKYPADKIVLITTGSQGEPMSALTRMSLCEHRKVTVSPNDFIIISANPIPGNEKLVNRVVNELMKIGAEVVYEKMYEVHASGHACQDEQKLMIGLTKPKFFIPFHGEYKHLKKHAETAKSMGVDKDNIFIGSIGTIIETNGIEMKFAGNVPAGNTLVDGLGVGDVGSIVLRDRKHLSQDGLIVIVVSIDSSSGQLVSGPDIVSRGFVYVREAEEMMNEAQHIAREELLDCIGQGITDWTTLKSKTKDAVSKFLYAQTRRSPMILPIIQDVQN